MTIVSPNYLLSIRKVRFRLLSVILHWPSFLFDKVMFLPIEFHVLGDNGGVKKMGLR